MTETHSDHGRIELSGALNLRDLGGLRTADGARVRDGRLYRSDSLAKLTDEDFERVAGLGLRLVVDFRTEDEVASDGPDRLPEQVRRLALPVGGGSIQQFYGLAMGGDPAKLREVLGNGGAQRIMMDINRGFVSNEDERGKFGDALRLMIDDELPLLFHCTAGKDRTGWMAAVVLSLLGVPREAILADYLASNEYFLPVATTYLSALSATGLDTSLFRPVLEQRPEYLLAAFGEAERHYGTFDGFVSRGLGVDASAVERLRRQLTD
ncbi:protein-tyrosine phosphatase [Stackebrandtia endophytica]|uniref:Protein-tyrosine phosphatase n=1 Tax=Stackebrandtia endophytica TaxID=1496996 RepID=A0A543ARL3_9ACTN|nr:tyrosine-protein phosphatase [Stackebrandtia endophytica]TQL75222.1 protein-tyrosine phosphatase [Stackebrandtia endophytica]